MCNFKEKIFENIAENILTKNYNTNFKKHLPRNFLAFLKKLPSGKLLPQYRSRSTVVHKKSTELRIKM